MSKLLDSAARIVCLIRGHDVDRQDSLANEARCRRCLRSLLYFNGRWWVVADRLF